MSFLFIKKRLWHGCFPVNVLKFLRTPFLQNTSGRLLLHAPILFKNTYCATEILIKEEYFSFPFIFVFWYIFVTMFYCWYSIAFSINGAHCSYLVLFIREFFVVFNLFESHVLFLRSSPSFMSFLNLLAIAELIHWFRHSLETTIVKKYG